MLGELERKITAVVGDGLAGRAGLAVVEAPAPLQPAAGEGTIRVGLVELAPQAVFEREQIELTTNGGPPVSRRVLPVRFTVRIEFRRQPAAQTPDALSAARALLL